MINPAADAALKYLAAELERAQLMVAQAVGSLAWKDTVIADLEQRIAQYEDLKQAV